MFNKKITLLKRLFVTPKFLLKTLQLTPELVDTETSELRQQLLDSSISIQKQQKKVNKRKKRRKI